MQRVVIGASVVGAGLLILAVAGFAVHWYQKEQKRPRRFTNSMLEHA